MPKGADLKAMIPWILSSVQDGEPVVIRFPRREAARRVANVEKHRRIIIQTDEQNYAEFHEQRERILRVLDENPTLFGLYLVTCLRHWSDEEIRDWKKEREGLEES